MKKLFVFLMLCVSFFSFSVFGVSAESETMVVISDSANLYLSIDYEDEKIFDISDDDGNDVNNLLTVISHNSEVSVVGEKIEKIITVSEKQKTFEFFKVDILKYNEKYSQNIGKNQNGEQDVLYAYILTYDVMPKEDGSLKIYLDTNGKIKADKNYETFKFDFHTNGYQVIGEIDAGTKIKVLSDVNAEMVKVQFQDEEYYIYTVYVKTEALDISRVSFAKIATVIVCISTISIILVLLGKKKGFFKKFAKKLKKSK